MSQSRRTLVAAVAAAFAFGAACSGSAAAQNVNWKFSTWGKQRAFTKGIELLAERVAKGSGGSFRITIGMGEQFSKARENLDGLKLNAIDAAHFCNFYSPGKNPAYMVFSLPFLPLAEWDVSLKVREALFKHPALVADMDRWNAMAYATTLLPQYEFLGKGKPPLTLADWKGRRVRAGGGLGDAMEAIGAIKTTTTATEVYTSMQRGTMDAASFPFTYAHFAYKTHEVSDWYTANMSPGTAECPIVFNKASYAKLSPAHKKLLEEARDEVNQAQIKAYVDIDKKNLPTLSKLLTAVRYTDGQLKEFRAVAGKPVWDKWVADNKGKFDAQGVLDLVFKTAEEAGR